MVGGTIFYSSHQDREEKLGAIIRLEVKTGVNPDKIKVTGLLKTEGKSGSIHCNNYTFFKRKNSKVQESAK
jgi:hypothetical protein